MATLRELLTENEVDSINKNPILYDLELDIELSEMKVKDITKISLLLMKTHLNLRDKDNIPEGNITLNGFGILASRNKFIFQNNKKNNKDFFSEELFKEYATTLSRAANQIM